MEIKTRLIYENTSLAKEVKRIYEDNFPEFERTPYHQLFKDKFAEVKKVAYIIDDKVAGFTFYYKERHLIYLIWFAVDKAFQGRGVGSQIIRRLIDENKNCDIALDIENPENAKDDERTIRIKREYFYEKFGFKRCGVVFDCSGDEYLPLCLGQLDSDKIMQVEEKFYPETSNVRELN